MNRFLLLLTYVCFSELIFAQSSLKILDFDGNDVSSTTVEVWGDTGTIIASKFKVVNMGSSALDVKVKRIEDNLIVGTQNYFCWTVCYSPTTDESPTGLMINAGDTNSSFYGDYLPNSNFGVSTITYVFFDSNNSNDSAYVIVNYNSSAVGVANLNQVNIFTGELMPNPARNTTFLKYKLESSHLPAKINIIDNQGRIVREINLLQAEGTTALPLNDLSTGRYSVLLQSKNKTVAVINLLVVY